MSGRDQFMTTTLANAAIEKHVKFWDRKNKGYITPIDTVFGFIHLGYGIVVSVTLGTFLGVLFSYSTQDSWMPDPMCRTRMEKLQKTSQGAPYDTYGQLDLDEFDKLFDKHAKSDISGKTITLKELMEWNEATYKDPLTWSATALEWLAIYLLVGNKGVVKREDILAAYDGTLFYKVRDRNKQHRTILDDSSSSAPSTSKAMPRSSSSLNISGVMVPKSYVRQLETQLNNAVNILPRSTVITLESRLRNWLSVVQQQQHQQHEHQRQPILKGVSTPAPTRRSLFGLMGNEHDSAEQGPSSSSPSLFTGGLTGVMAINLLDRSMALTGVQGYEKGSSNSSDDGSPDDINSPHLSGLMQSSLDDDAHNDQDDDIAYGASHTSYTLAGVRPEGEDYYRDSPQINWLRSAPLTGVSPSTSLTTRLADHDDDNDDDNDFDEHRMRSSSLTGIVSTPPLTTDQGSVSSDLDDPKLAEDKDQRQPSCTPPFTGSPSSHDEEDDDDDDLPDSPNDATPKPNDQSSNDSLKKPGDRASWPSLTEVVPSED